MILHLIGRGVAHLLELRRAQNVRRRVTREAAMKEPIEQAVLLETHAQLLVLCLQVGRQLLENSLRNEDAARPAECVAVQCHTKVSVVHCSLALNRDCENHFTHAYQFAQRATTMDIVGDFLITGESMHRFEVELQAMRAEMRAMRSENDTLRRRVDTLLDRLEVADARKQNKLIRTHAPVPAFKTASVPTPQPAQSSTFSFIPATFRERLANYVE